MTERALAGESMERGEGETLAGTTENLKSSEGKKWA